MPRRRKGPAPLVAVVGPTASGKSALAVELALRLDGEVVSCDALQVYRDLDIGTAKPSEVERRGVPHHLLDLVAPTETFSAADYAQRAARAIVAIDRRRRLPLVVGGTGLYLRALRRGLFQGPGRDPDLRARLRRFADRRAPGSLHRLLTKLDPASAERIHRNDTVRIVRALEVRLLTGRPISALMANRRSPLPGFRAILVGLAPSREELGRRVQARVDSMFARGLMEEVAALIERYGADVPAFKAIGYRECVRAVRGEIDRETARELTVRATRAYAKRQMTWFRREADVHWFHGCGDDAPVREAVFATVRRELADGGTGSEMETANAETGP